MDPLAMLLSASMLLVTNITLVPMLQNKVAQYINSNEESRHHSWPESTVWFNNLLPTVRILQNSH